PPKPSMTRNRVSSRLTSALLVSLMGRSKCLTNTVPVGNDQELAGEKEICSDGESWVPSLGTPIQRRLAALSDQSGTLTVYGCKPETGVNEARFVKAPTWESKAGGSGTTTAIAFSLKIWPPPVPPTLRKYGSPLASEPIEDVPS